MPRSLLMSAERVQRTINRLACEIVERNRGGANLVVVGMRTRGAALAEALAAEIARQEGAPVPLGRLNVEPFRDDRDAPERAIDPAEAPPPIADRDVILVDDVLFTGRTVRAALDALVRFGRPRSIQLAVLVDRGHREYPVQPNYVGRLVQTKYRERVVVTVEEGFSVYVEE